MRSEFDYSTKKKFVDIVKTNPNRSKLREGVLDGFNGGKGENDRMSNISRRTGMSIRSGKQSEYGRGGAARNRLNKTVDDADVIQED
jgi:hypothetical protein